MHPSIFNVASRQADIFGQQKIKLTAKTGSMIEALVREFFVNPEGSRYTELRGSLVDELSKLILPHISFAKNTVIPRIKELHDKVNNSFSNILLEDPISNLNIQYVDIPDLVNSPELEDIMSIYNDYQTPLIPKKILSLKEISEDEILSLVLTNYDYLDEHIKIWIAENNITHDGLFLKNVYNDTFLNNQLLNKLHTFEDHYIINIALAILLMTRNLTNRTDLIENVSLNEWTTFIREVRDYAGVLLAKATKRIKSYQETNILVLGRNESVLYLNGDVYRNWIKQGGKIEAIYGLFLSGDTSVSLRQVTDKEEDLVETYRSYMSMYVATSKINQFASFKNILKSEFALSLQNDIVEEEKEIRIEDANYSNTLTKLTNEFFSDLSHTSMDDIYYVCAELVSRVRFYFTDSHLILKNIDESMKLNPNLDLREAAMLSTLNYITLFVMDQINVERMN